MKAKRATYLKFRNFPLIKRENPTDYQIAQKLSRNWSNLQP